MFRAKQIILACASVEAFHINVKSSCHNLCIYMDPQTHEETKRELLKGSLTFIHAYIFSDSANIGCLAGSSWMLENSPHREFGRGGFHLIFFCDALQAQFSRTTVEPLQMSPPPSKCAVPDLFQERVASVLTPLHTTFGPALHASGPFSAVAREEKLPFSPWALIHPCLSERSVLLWLQSLCPSVSTAEKLIKLNRLRLKHQQWVQTSSVMHVK